MVENDETSGGASARPPGEPWRPLADTGRGYLSVYFSEQMARWPVREITRRGDNKSDPNIETGTYGLFSTCEPSMRNRIVKDGAATIFFITTHKPGHGRVMSGYYHVGHYTEGTQGAVNRDFALAADLLRFIDPIPVGSLPEPLAAFCSVPFRQIRPTDVDATRALRAICDNAEDRTEEYLAEVSRVERFAYSQTELSYPSWGRDGGFTWADAPEYYQTDDDLSKVPNSSKNKKWRCRECDFVIKSGALLKKCPLCKKTATLVPETEAAA
ncbi:hypothetical protein ACEXQB_006515 [Herbiconiux sp. P18]|uniref:hypothetical protein n=1 Tax=Herbiconiux liangxiaofengii TaxID=3342795 RepID=UPI0035B792FB